MKISVIIPVYNERDTILEIIKRIEAVELDKEIIIVDDKSTDGTSDILRNNFGQEKDIKSIFLERNYGKGFAIRSALPYVTGDIVIIQDADLEYDPNDYKNLIRPIKENGAFVVYGSRFMNLNKPLYIMSWFSSKLRGRQCKIGHNYLSNFLGIQMLNFLVRICYGNKITDEATCYKVFKSDIFKNLTLKSVGFEFCSEITAKVCKLGYKIYEVPISYHPRTKAHGKKVSFKDGIKSIATIIKYRFVD